MPKLLVHLHLYYHDQLDWFLSKLKNISGCEWTLVVTLCAHNAQSEAKIRRFKADAVILPVENAGYDIWPFICALQHVNLADFDVVLKLHTKNARKDSCGLFGVKWRGYYWRELLVEPLLGTPARFLKNWRKFAQSPSVGMIASEPCLLHRTEEPLFDEFHARMGIKSRNSLFCAGTMFFIRVSALLPLLRAGFKASDFAGNQCTGAVFSAAHAMERMFVPLVCDAGLSAEGVPWLKHTFKRWGYVLTHRMLAVDKEDGQKVFWLLGCKIKLGKRR